MKTATAASADSYSAFALVRRLVVDEALSHWRRYAVALALMGAAAAATPAAVTDQVRMAMLVAATANRNRVLGTLVLPPLLTGLAGPLYGYASCWAISSYSSPVGGSAAGTDSADGHFLSSTCGISQVARKASAAIGTATMKTVWIDSA